MIGSLCVFFSIYVIYRRIDVTKPSAPISFIWLILKITQWEIIISFQFCFIPARISSMTLRERKYKTLWIKLQTFKWPKGQSLNKSCSTFSILVHIYLSLKFLIVFSVQWDSAPWKIVKTSSSLDFRFLSTTHQFDNVSWRQIIKKYQIFRNVIEYIRRQCILYGQNKTRNIKNKHVNLFKMVIFLEY